MRNTISFFLRHYLFWLLFFIAFKAAFLMMLLPFDNSIPVSEILTSLAAGYRLDLSVASYLVVIPVLLYLLKIAGNHSFFIKGLHIYYALIIPAALIICVANMIVYQYWGTLINNRAVSFLANPKEMLASASNIMLLGVTIGLTTFSVLLYRIFRKGVIHVANKIEDSVVSGIISMALLVPVVVIALRGGLQLIPVNESAAVYSLHPKLNQAAINPVWYLGHNLRQSGLTEKNPYHFTDSVSAQKITAELLHKSLNDTTAFFNFSHKPNVIIILLESWTADIIEPLGGIKGVTPNFNRLASNGILFSSIYSSGFRTDQALVSVLSGFPSQPKNSIIRFPAKVASLPSLGATLKNYGYTNSFYYGGETGFANMNSYLINSGFHKIISIDDFPSGQRNSKWGVHDGYLFEKHLKDMAESTRPFFSTLLTLSTHEPFEVPIATPFNLQSEPELFKKSAWYTDKCLGDYFEAASKSAWFQNTVFIIMADHGHRLPLNRDYFDPASRRIPLLIYSAALRNEFRGKQIQTLANQHDVAPTLLNQLQIPDTAFKWSVSITDPERNSFVYLSLDMAITWKNERETVIIPFEPGYEIFEGEQTCRDTARAYLQHLYSTFIAM